jgi:hypothetical protein
MDPGTIMRLFRLGGREVQLQGRPTGRTIGGLLKRGAGLLREAGEDDRTSAIAGEYTVRITPDGAFRVETSVAAQ